MTIRVSKILQETNLGLDTLNKYLELAGLETVSVNSRLDEYDYKLIHDLLNDNNICLYDEIALEFYRKTKLIRAELQKKYIDNRPLKDNIGLLQKKYYFKKITSDYKKVITRYNLIDSSDYTDDSFHKLYDLWYSGELDNYKQKMAKETLSNIKSYDIQDNVSNKTRLYRDETDYESSTIGALRYGYGDVLGF